VRYRCIECGRTEYSGLFTHGRDVCEAVAADREGQCQIENDLAWIVKRGGLRHGEKALDKAAFRPVFRRCGSR